MESRNYYFFKGNPIIFPAFLFHRSFFSLSVSPPYLETRFSFCHNDRVAKTIVSRALKHKQTNKQTNAESHFLAVFDVLDTKQNNFRRIQRILPVPLLSVLVTSIFYFNNAMT